MTDAVKARRRARRGLSERPATPIAAREHRRDGRGLDREARSQIGQRLRSLYDSVVQQPVPDRFRDLIERLDAEEPNAP